MIPRCAEDFLTEVQVLRIERARGKGASRNYQISLYTYKDSKDSRRSRFRRELVKCKIMKLDRQQEDQAKEKPIDRSNK